MRKSRLEGSRPSQLPKPRRPGSTDRLSVEARRSAVARSSSAEPPRATFGARLSREASATKLPMNGRSRSQTADQRFGQTSMTPLRSSHYSRPTTTPQRTPSEDRVNRSWRTSLDRALAFVTIKDQRPITNVAWQRSEVARVQEFLLSRGGGMTLIRPLTIARFVDIVSSLLNSIMQDVKLNTDNYVAKLPHVMKRVLYPGAVSRSWLRTVNTLHAFPHALAALAYLAALLQHIENPVQDEWIYMAKDELGSLRRDYLNKCWIRFQEPEHQYEDLNQEYLQNLQCLLGNDDERIRELRDDIKRYEASLEDPEELAARAQHAAAVQRRNELVAMLKTERGKRKDMAIEKQGLLRKQKEMLELIDAMDNEIHSAQSESQQLKRELEQQSLTVAERTKLLDEVHYAAKVQNSKRALAEQIENMLQSKEVELTSWQQRTLDRCVQYKQGLIHLAADYPHLAGLAIDENDLMAPECSAHVSRGTETLRELCKQLSAQKSARARDKCAAARQRQAVAEEARAKISELQSTITREQQCLDSLIQTEQQQASTSAALLTEIYERVEELEGRVAEYGRVRSEMELWEKTDESWRSKISAMHESIAAHKENYHRLLETAKSKRAQIIKNAIQQWYHKIDTRG